MRHPYPGWSSILGIWTRKGLERGESLFTLESRSSKPPVPVSPKDRWVSHPLSCPSSYALSGPILASLLDLAHPGLPGLPSHPNLIPSSSPSPLGSHARRLPLPPNTTPFAPSFSCAPCNLALKLLLWLPPPRLHSGSVHFARIRASSACLPLPPFAPCPLPSPPGWSRPLLRVPLCSLLCAARVPRPLSRGHVRPPPHPPPLWSPIAVLSPSPSQRQSRLSWSLGPTSRGPRPNCRGPRMVGASALRPEVAAAVRGAARELCNPWPFRRRGRKGGCSVVCRPGFDALAEAPRSSRGGRRAPSCRSRAARSGWRRARSAAACAQRPRGIEALPGSSPLPHLA